MAWSGWLTIALLLAAVLPAFDDRGPALLEGAVELPDWALRGAEMAGWGFRWIPWVALASLVPRYLGADRDTRIQIRWFVVASVSIGLAVADELVELPGWLLTLNAPPWVPAAIAVAVLRHRLYDIDVIVRRSIVYGGLLAGVVVVYVAVVGVVSALFGVTVSDLRWWQPRWWRWRSNRPVSGSKASPSGSCTAAGATPRRRCRALTVT